MNWDTTQQFVRIMLQFGAGTLVSKGIITAEMGTTAVGALMSLGSVAWWAYWNRKTAAPAIAATK